MHSIELLYLSFEDGRRVMCVFERRLDTFWGHKMMQQQGHRESSRGTTTTSVQLVVVHRTVHRMNVESTGPVTAA